MSPPRSPSSLSEGEIVSGDEEKAISTNASILRDSKVNQPPRLDNGSSSRTAQFEGIDGLSNDVNYHFRDADGTIKSSRERSPSRRDRSRSRSPYRAGKSVSGDKRRHEEDHYTRRGGSDPRRFKVHYEGPSRDPGHRSRRRYVDLDRPEPLSTGHPPDVHGPRGRVPSHMSKQDRARDRDRSRSPFRHSKIQPLSDQQAGSLGEIDGRQGNGRLGGPQLSREKDGSTVKMSLSQHPTSRSNASKSKKLVPFCGAVTVVANSILCSHDHFKSVADPADEVNEAASQLTEAELIEQRRKRREAIKAKHKGNNPPLLVQALEAHMPSAPPTPFHDSSGGTSEQQSPPSSIDSPRTPQGDSPSDSPAAFAVTSDEELVDRRHTDSAVNEEEGPSAADYDPNLDMEEDRPEHKKQTLQESVLNDMPDNDPQQGHEGAPKQSREFDMFADEDDDDMFAPPETTNKSIKGAAKQAKALDQSLLDNWDYPDGHYRIILGELLDGRYAVQQQIGKGTFATVVRAQDTRTGNQVAVKIACNNETMYKAGQKEMDMLRLLNQNDPDDKKHIIRLLRHFDHKGHLCLVFENLSADLREVLKKFGRNVGLNLKAIRSYAQQMFLALSHLKKCQILHADLKPDNILVSERRSLLKICDLGTAAFSEDAEVTPYLVSRFYRAPEVILGMPFDYAIDMWSIGCTLFELYTGRILFAGADNNQMLRAIQECRGKFPIRMLKRATLADKHFDEIGNFFSQERDKITGKQTMRQLNFNKTTPGKDLRSRLSGNAKGMKPEELKEHAAFVDLMDKCLQLDPARRVTPNEALRHGFIAHVTAAGQQAEKGSTQVKVAMNVPRMR